MTTSEKALLLAGGAFAILTLVLGMLLPLNRLFVMPSMGRVSLYIGAIVFFLLLSKFRQNTKLALVFMWILCAFCMVTVVLFVLAVMHV
ncbi:hypothetical protein LJC56_08840 [Christensenellaceae bacterium OttesenSCG-928-K19]|nr:hypothetical protein [Christensenellaceae bacterium OttesenSCG-928-K19]